MWHSVKIELTTRSTRQTAFVQLFFFIHCFSFLLTVVIFLFLNVLFQFHSLLLLHHLPLLPFLLVFFSLRFFSFTSPSFHYNVHCRRNGWHHHSFPYLSFLISIRFSWYLRQFFIFPAPSPKPPFFLKILTPSFYSSLPWQLVYYKSLLWSQNSQTPAPLHEEKWHVFWRFFYPKPSVFSSPDTAIFQPTDKLQFELSSLHQGPTPSSFQIINSIWVSLLLSGFTFQFSTISFSRFGKFRFLKVTFYSFCC